MSGKRILIVNRGEIASRIGRACRELGHVPIGIWTDNEVNATHLEHCDEWVYLEGSSNAETYLNIPNLLKVIEDYEVDAVHPGYGFLSENDEFAQLLEERGTIFIGPSSQYIKAMGDKAEAKKIAIEAGISVVPGSDGILENYDHAEKLAKDIGYPVILKAVAGGGGRGMRVCYGEEELKASFVSASREAEASFSRGDLIMEKFIENPRHIEVQVLADKKGNSYHFFERECSIQRKHQKLVEEAPSPFIGDDEKLRQEICGEALKLVRHIGYDNVGTVEFVFDGSKKFYFLEMNTRIQVEHTVTEEITGIDLVVCMIQSALGEDMKIPSQEWITKSGHAIECRICAEDPLTLNPSPGKVSAFETIFPQGTRFDHCLYRDLVITPDFDPMVGKLVTKGLMRWVAIRKMKAALKGLLIEGLKTNLAVHLAIMDDEFFVSGNYTTKFIEERSPQTKINTKFDHKRVFRRLAAIEARTMGL